MKPVRRILRWDMREKTEENVIKNVSSVVYPDQRISGDLHPILWGTGRGIVSHVWIEAIDAPQ